MWAFITSDLANFCVGLPAGMLLGGCYITYLRDPDEYKAHRKYMTGVQVVCGMLVIWFLFSFMRALTYLA